MMAGFLAPRSENWWMTSSSVLEEERLEGKSYLRTADYPISRALQEMNHRSEAWGRSQTYGMIMVKTRD